jgi:hypothetical protein
MDDRVTAAERRLVARMAAAHVRRRGLSAPLRYVLAVASVAVAETAEWLVFGVWLGRTPTTFVELIVAVVVSSRFFGAGPGCLTAALCALDVAYDLSLNGSFPTERFFGIVATYLAIVIALCADASWPRGLRAPSRRSSSPHQPSSITRHMLIEWLPKALPGLVSRPL